MEPVRISYRWTADELIEAQKQHTSTILRPLIINLLTGFCTLMSGVGLLLIFRDLQRGHGVSIIGIQFTLFWLFLLFIQIFSMKVSPMLTRKSFSARENANGMLDYEFSAQGLKHQNSGAILVKPWSEFSRLVEVKTGFMIYFGKKFYWLPNSGFTQPSGAERLKQLAHSAQLPILSKGRRVRIGGVD